MENTNKQVVSQHSGERVTETQIDKVMKDLRDFIDNNQLNDRVQRMCIEAQDLLRRAKHNLNTIECFNCGDLVNRDEMHYWYAFDQDNLVCTECAKKLKHTETCYTGLPVLKEAN